MIGSTQSRAGASRSLRENAIEFVRTLARMFFRSIEIDGADNVPASGGGLLVAWHPNGVIDPVLVATSSPRAIVFGARDGLFKIPLIGGLMRAVGTVPIYRAADAKAGGGAGDAVRRERNRQSLDALARAIADGSLSALFPEGVSHDAPHLQEIKFGAAKLFQRAQQLAPSPPFLVPIGLHYDDKSAFRSRVLVSFHPPIELPPELRHAPEAADETAARAHTAALTRAIEQALIDAVHPTESWELHHLMHRTRTLVRAERGKRAGVRHDAGDMRERTMGFARVWRGYHASKARDAQGTAALLARVAAYDAEMQALHLSDEALDDGPRLLSPWLPILFVLQALLVYGLFPPVLIAGWVLNALPYFALEGIARLVSKESKDIASVKMFGGMFLFPIAWGAAGWAAARGVIDLHARFPAVSEVPCLAAASTVALAIGGGFLALRYAEMARETLESLRVRFTRRLYREALERLRRERSELTDAIVKMAEGVELPGRAHADGRVAQ